MRFAITLLAVFSFSVGCRGRDHSSLAESSAEPGQKTSKMADGTDVKWKKPTEEELKALGVKNIGAFGEAWKDPSGMIWGDMIKNKDGSPRIMGALGSRSYCKEIGAKLPSNDDFIRLTKYMGANWDMSKQPWQMKGYSPQVLPNLVYLEGGKTKSRFFWTSSDDLADSVPKLYYYFIGENGFYEPSENTGFPMAARCVASKG